MYITGGIRRTISGYEARSPDASLARVTAAGYRVTLRTRLLLLVGPRTVALGAAPAAGRSRALRESMRAQAPARVPQLLNMSSVHRRCRVRAGSQQTTARHAARVVWAAGRS